METSNLSSRPKRLKRDCSPTKTILKSTVFEHNANTASTESAASNEDKCQEKQASQLPTNSPSCATSKRYLGPKKWTFPEKLVFFEGLREHGRCFNKIAKLFEQRSRNKSDIHNRDFGQCRYFFTRSIKRIASFPQIKLNCGIRKKYIEILALVNYGEILRKTGRELNKRTAENLNDMIHKGFTIMKVPGRMVRVKTPMCSVVKRFTRTRETYSFMQLPQNVTFEFTPKTSTDFNALKDSKIINPFLRITVPISKSLKTVLELVEQKINRNNILQNYQNFISSSSSNSKDVNNANANMCNYHSPTLTLSEMGVVTAQSQWLATRKLLYSLHTDLLTQLCCVEETDKIYTPPPSFNGAQQMLAQGIGLENKNGQTTASKMDNKPKTPTTSTSNIDRHHNFISRPPTSSTPCLSNLLSSPMGAQINSRDRGVPEEAAVATVNCGFGTSFKTNQSADCYEKTDTVSNNNGCIKDENVCTKLEVEIRESRGESDKVNGDDNARSFSSPLSNLSSKALHCDKQQQITTDQNQQPLLSTLPRITFLPYCNDSSKNVYNGHSSSGSNNSEVENTGNKEVQVASSQTNRLPTTVESSAARAVDDNVTSSSSHNVAQSQAASPYAATATRFSTQFYSPSSQPSQIIYVVPSKGGPTKQYVRFEKCSAMTIDHSNNTRESIVYKLKNGFYIDDPIVQGPKNDQQQQQQQQPPSQTSNKHILNLAKLSVMTNVSPVIQMQYTIGRSDPNCVDNHHNSLMPPQHIENGNTLSPELSVIVELGRCVSKSKRAQTPVHFSGNNPLQTTPSTSFDQDLNCEVNTQENNHGNLQSISNNNAPFVAQAGSCAENELRNHIMMLQSSGKVRLRNRLRHNPNNRSNPNVVNQQYAAAAIPKNCANSVNAAASCVNNSGSSFQPIPNLNNHPAAPMPVIPNLHHNVHGQSYKPITPKLFNQISGSVSLLEQSNGNKRMDRIVIGNHSNGARVVATPFMPNNGCQQPPPHQSVLSTNCTFTAIPSGSVIAPVVLGEGVVGDTPGACLLKENISIDSNLMKFVSTDSTNSIGGSETHIPQANNTTMGKTNEDAFGRHVRNVNEDSFAEIIKVALSCDDLKRSDVEGDQVLSANGSTVLQNNMCVPNSPHSHVLQPQPPLLTNMEYGGGRGSNLNSFNTVEGDTQQSAAMCNIKLGNTPHEGNLPQSSNNISISALPSVDQLLSSSGGKDNVATLAVMPRSNHQQQQQQHRPQLQLPPSGQHLNSSSIFTSHKSSNLNNTTLFNHTFQSTSTFEVTNEDSFLSRQLDGEIAEMLNDNSIDVAHKFDAFLNSSSTNYSNTIAAAAAATSTTEQLHPSAITTPPIY